MLAEQGIDRSSTFKELKLLREIGALTIVSSRPPEGVVLARVECGLWAFAQSLIERTQDHGPLSDGTD